MDTSKYDTYVTHQQGVHFFTRGILSNFDDCPQKFVDVDSKQAYQWSYCVEALREDLAEEVMLTITPLESKRIASVIKTPGSNWHDIKYGIMEMIL